jgi:hypothetical protein
MGQLERDARNEMRREAWSCYLFDGVPLSTAATLRSTLPRDIAAVAKAMTKRAGHGR